MKKIIALLITFGSFATAFSQSSKIDEAKRVINGEPERKVYSETGTRYPSRTVNERSYSYNKKCKKKGNNGKHLGWEKGVGNPHRTGNVYKNGNGKNRGKKG